MSELKAGYRPDPKSFMTIRKITYAAPLANAWDTAMSRQNRLITGMTDELAAYMKAHPQYRKSEKDGAQVTIFNDGIICDDNGNLLCNCLMEDCTAIVLRQPLEWVDG